jgi:hypothetical protein
MKTSQGHMKIDTKILDKHQQIGEYSCIPSAVEMVLKLLGKVDPDYHEQQKEWSNKPDGSFADFDGKKIEGVTFRVPKINAPRGSSFPLAELFGLIDRELESGKLVIISLPAKNKPSDYHMYVIYEVENDDYLAVTKDGSNTSMINDVKKQVKKMQGTDVLVYELSGTAEKSSCPSMFKHFQ